MPGRGWMVVFLAGAAGLPYVLSQPSVRNALTSPLHWVNAGTAETKKPAGPGVPDGPVSGDSEGRVSSGKIEEAAVSLQSATVEPRKAGAATAIPFEQALRWDTKPAWVMAAWPRVTTELPDLEMQGYRIAYVSGTTESDLAGSLTYYFDGTQQLQKIAFSGSTGDAKRLVQFLLSQHRFERRLGDDPSTYLYQVEEDGRALSEARIKAAPIVRTGNPLRRFEVTLEMRRPEE